MALVEWVCTRSNNAPTALSSNGANRPTALQFMKLETCRWTSTLWISIKRSGILWRFPLVHCDQFRRRWAAQTSAALRATVFMCSDLVVFLPVQAECANFPPLKVCRYWHVCFMPVGWGWDLQLAPEKRNQKETWMCIPGTNWPTHGCEVTTHDPVVDGCYNNMYNIYIYIYVYIYNVIYPSHINRLNSLWTTFTIISGLLTFINRLHVIEIIIAY